MAKLVLNVIEKNKKKLKKIKKYLYDFIKIKNGFLYKNKLGMFHCDFNSKAVIADFKGQPPVFPVIGINDKSD
jgi:hypothetical protein